MNLTVKRVWRDIQGSPLASAVSIGATSAVVEEVVDFDENGGDFVIGVDSGTYTGYDETTKTIQGLSPALTVAHPKGTFLQEGAEPRGPKYADGYIDDQDGITESILIPSHLRKFFPIGGREADEMEVVEVGTRNDGSLVVRDAPKDEDRADAPVVFTWSLAGNVSTGTRPHRFAMPFGGSIEEVKMVMGDGGAPTGSSIIVDILKGGSSILGTKITVPATELSSDLIEPTTKEVSKGNIIQVEFEQVGSTLPGSDPTLYMTVFPSETAISGRVEVEGPQGPAGSDGVITEVQNEGVALADQPIMNFTGAGVDVTVAGGKYVVDVSGGGGGAPTTADYLVGTAQAGLSAEIVVGTSPGGELGGTWASPTVDATHSGSSHASVQAAAEATAASALASHVAAADPHTGYVQESLFDAKGDILTATADNTPARKAVGANGTLLVANSAEATGLEWRVLADGDIPSSIARDSEVTSAISTHEADTTSVHGISNTADVLLRTIADAKGDLIAGTAADTVARKAVGANGTLLVANSSESTGLEWRALADADIPASIARDSELIMTRIAETVLASATASITFSSIAGTYRHLRVVLLARGDTGSSATTAVMRFNGDTGANYDFVRVRGTTTTVDSAEQFGQTRGNIAPIPAATAGAGLAGHATVDIPYYARTDFNKTYQAISGSKRGTSAGDMFVDNWFGSWRSSVAITSITLLPVAGNFDTGTVAVLYGWS